MGFNRYTRRLSAWIACFAILLAALAPSISHALAHADKSGFSIADEICSADGIKSIKALGGSPQGSAPADTATHFEHCPFCLTHAGFVGLLPGEDMVIPLAAGSPIRPPLFFHSPRPIFAWAAAQPRAPPTVS